MLKSILWIGILMLFSAFGSFGQSVVNATGGTLSSGGGRLDYAIGEIATSTISSTQNHLTQGVLQPLTVLVGTNDLFDKQFKLLAYPNPVGSELFIETDYTGFKMLEVFDINGKRLRSQEWDEQPIDFQPLPAGTYTVRLHDNSFAKTIKIIKQ